MAAGRSMTQNTSPLWPQIVHDAITNLSGKPISIHPLSGGQSQANVWRVQFAHQSVIVKRTKQSREMLFYTTIAPLLREENIPIPQLEWSGVVDDNHWLVLEDVSTPLPRTRWRADPEVLAVLRRLHQSRLPVQSEASLFFCPTWTDALTRDALLCFPEASANRLSPLLQEVQQTHQYLFAPHCWISGDPNPTNWGVRYDGTVVLYDWERFGRGIPAIDLAITVPGLGEIVTFRAVADRYLSRQTDFPSQAISSRTALVHDMVVAKTWTVIEYLSGYSRGILARSTTIDMLVQQLPPWLESMLLEDF
jgi:thiamine kinase-like enzyme